MKAAPMLSAFLLMTAILLGSSAVADQGEGDPPISKTPSVSMASQKSENPSVVLKNPCSFLI